MGLATELAQKRVKTGDHAPRYELTLGGRNIDDRLFDCTATFSSDGTSDLSLSVDTDLERHDGDKVILKLGYGSNLFEYFGGWLEEPVNNHWGQPSTGDAYGPFKELGELFFDDDVTYAGQTLGQALVDMHSRARGVTSTFKIRGNPSYTLSGSDAGVSIGSSLSDGIGTVLEMAGWRSSDRPGFERLYSPIPRPSPSLEPTATYTEAHFPPDSFHVMPNKKYGSVGAFQRDDSGNFKWTPPFVVVDPTYPRLRTYWLEDYQGDEASAWADVARLARMLKVGTFSWSLEGISANPELLLYDSIRVHTTETRDTGGRIKDRFEVIYDCLIDTSITVDVSRDGMPMTLAGDTAIRNSSKQIPRPFFYSHPAGAVMR